MDPKLTTQSFSVFDEHAIKVVARLLDINDGEIQNPVIRGRLELPSKAWASTSWWIWQNPVSLVQLMGWGGGWWLKCPNWRRMLVVSWGWNKRS